MCYYIKCNAIKKRVIVVSENTELQNNEEIQENEEYTGETESEEVYEDEQEEYVYSEPRIITILKRILNKKVIAVVIAVVILLQALTSVILANSVLSSGKFSDSDKSENIIRKSLSEQKYIDWLTSISTDKYIENSEGSKLHAAELKNYETSHSYIILCHPMTAQAKDLAVYAYHFYDLGFNVMLPDARGCGESEYKKLDMGWYDRHDVLLWVDEIIKSDKDARIFLFGLGMGGSTVLMASSLDLPANVKGIISDSAYADVHELFKENIKNIYGVSSFPVVNMASLYVKLTQGWSFKEADAIEQVKNAKVPVLFIHGGDDNIVPVSHSNDLYEACSAKGSDHLLISGASHAKARETNEEKYWLNVDLFILDNIQNTP